MRRQLGPHLHQYIRFCSRNSSTGNSSAVGIGSSNWTLSDFGQRREVISDQLFTQFRPVPSAALNNAMVGGNLLAAPHLDEILQHQNNQSIPEQPWLTECLIDLTLSKTGSVHFNHENVDYVSAADVQLIQTAEKADPALSNEDHCSLESPDKAPMEYQADSVRRKRRHKMRRHKYRKRLKETRAQRRRAKQRKDNAASRAEAVA